MIVTEAKARYREADEMEEDCIAIRGQILYNNIGWR